MFINVPNNYVTEFICIEIIFGGSEAIIKIIIKKTTNKMHYIDLFIIPSQRCFRPSSGALDCIYSIW